MNERERMDVFKCVAVTLALVQNLPFCVKRMTTGPLATHQISVQSVQPFPRYGKGMRTYSRARAFLTLAFVKRLAIGSQTNTKFQRSPSICFRDAIKRCARAHVQLCPTINF